MAPQDGSPTRGQKHHYVPKFYLKAWVGLDHRLCVFRRPHPTVLASKRRFPDETGYRHGLYAMDGVPPEHREFMERAFFGITDQLAWDALTLLLARRIDDVDRSDWSRFLLSMLHRNPEKVQWIKEQARAYFLGQPDRVPKDLVTSIEVNAAGVLRKIIDAGISGTRINAMVWGILTLEKLRSPLLTSDRPVILSGAMIDPNAFLAMPISPNLLFVAANSPQVVERFRQPPADAVAAWSNHRIAFQAAEFVYGCDDRQRRFVENRLGRGVPQFLGDGRRQPDWEHLTP